MDPQSIYSGEDLAFFGATTMRTLTAFKYSPDLLQATMLVPDAATDTGTHNADGTLWSFTLRNGMKWQDGSPVTCADFKYGVSRTFATDQIFGGPMYAIEYLDIPTDADGNSQYPGPFKANAEQQALFDRAVGCNGQTITFHLKYPVPDFNYTVTLGFAAVPSPVDHPGVDTREKYGTAPWSDGPYVIDTYLPGNRLVLKRNPYWTAASDDHRGAYPDQWVVKFLMDPELLQQELMQSTGDERFALSYGPIQPGYLDTIFANPHTAAPEFAGRAFSDYGQGSEYGASLNYYWIRTDKVPNQQIREAMAVALDRDAIRAVSGDGFMGDFADGVLSPGIGVDYAPTHLWDAQGPFGQDVPPTGDPTLARELIQQSGEPAPTVTWDYLSSPTRDQVAGIIQDSLQKVGFTVRLQALPSTGHSCVLDPDCQGEFGEVAWGPDWPNASTVIPPLFTPAADSAPWGGFDLSRVSSDNYPGFESAVKDALTTLDRMQQSQQWQALDREAADQMFAIPTFWDLTQRLAGTGIGNLYTWPAYGGTWPYAQLYAKQ